MRIKSSSKIYFSLVLGIFLLVSNSCGNQENEVPEVYFHFTIDLDKYNNLTTPGFSQKYDSVGYAGVIVICEYYDAVNPASSLYHAYDAACTLEVSDTCSIEPVDNGITAICPCCGSVFALLGGYVQSGEAEYLLKEYDTSMINGKLHVYN